MLLRRHDSLSLMVATKLILPVPVHAGASCWYDLHALQTIFYSRDIDQGAWNTRAFQAYTRSDGLMSTTQQNAPSSVMLILSDRLIHTFQRFSEARHHRVEAKEINAQNCLKVA